MWCYGQYFLIFPKIVESFLIMWMVKNKVNKLTKLICDIFLYLTVYRV